MYKCEICDGLYSYAVGKHGERWCVSCNMAVRRVTDIIGTSEEKVELAFENVRAIKRHLQDRTGFVVPAIVGGVVYLDFVEKNTGKSNSG